MASRLNSLDDIAALACLVIDLSGRLEEFAEGDGKSINMKIDKESTIRAGEPVYTVEIVEDFLDQMTTFRVGTLDFKMDLIEHGD